MNIPLALCLSLLGLPGLRAQQLQFQEVSQSVGLDAVLDNAPDHPAGPMNGGASIADLDGNGYADIFIPSSGIHPDRIYAGQANGNFIKTFPTILGASSLYRGVGSTIGDFNQDGLLDIYITSYGDMAGPPSPGANRLYRNNGDGSYTNVAASAGVAFDSATMADGWGCCFGDYDLDGDLDLFVCGWEGAGEGSRLYRNEGNSTFSDQSLFAGIDLRYLRAFSPCFVDLDGDRYPELLVAADYSTTAIYHNLHGGQFEDASAGLRPDKVSLGMGHSLGDFDGNGFLDWYITSTYFDTPPGFANGNRLYLNQGLGAPLLAVPFANGVDNGGWGWGTASGDFDLDGDLDLAEVNGWVTAEWLGESSYLYLNNGSANFTESSQVTGFADVGQGRGLLRFDYQNDGDLDLLVLNNQGPVHLYRNDLNPGLHWLRVVVDTSGNSALAPGGYGTALRAEYQGSQHLQVLDGGSNFLGCSPMAAHFGLGTNAVVDQLVIEWADGFRTVLNQVSADQTLSIAATEALTQDASIHRGTPFRSTLRGVLPGETVLFLASVSGTTPFGAPIPDLGGLQSNLRKPIFLLGSSHANSRGVATIQARLASWFPRRQLATQAVIGRGVHGIASLKSNVILRQIQP